MKSIKKKITSGIIKKRSKREGFTLIETLISLFLVLIGVLFITRIIIFSLDLNKKSFIRLILWQKVENQIHTFLSKPYDSENLQPGNHISQEYPFEIKWTVNPISTSLKKIYLSVSYKQLVRESYFYKSKTIKTNPDF